MNACMLWPRSPNVVRLAALVLALAALAGPVRAEYVTIVVDEVSGHDRNGWPIQVGVPIPEDHSTEDLWLAQVEGEGQDEALRATPFQVLDVIEAEWPGDAPRNPVQAVEIAFFADLPADTSVRYRLYHGEAASERAPAKSAAELAIETSEGLARTIDPGPVRFRFHRHSGQLLSYEPAGSDHRFGFVIPERERPVHHNPDTWAPPPSWGHASGWDIEQAELAPDYEEAAGPIAWRSARTGTLPGVPGAQATVTYTAFAGMPFLLESSEIRFTRDTAVIAIRNNELVFSRGQHTHGLYIDRAGRTHAFRAFDPDDPEKGFRHIREKTLPPDTPLMALFSDIRGHGIGMVTQTRHAASGGVASAQAGGAHYYFNDGIGGRPADYHFLYFTRAEVFNHEGGWNTTVVPAGSVYAETSAIVVFDVGEAGGRQFEDAERWTALLRRPPRVRIADGVRVLP